MPLLHDGAVKASIESRLSKLTPQSRAAWGKMTVGQMLWHVNQAMDAALGRLPLPAERPPIPRPVIRFMVLNMPWTKNAPTSKAFVPQQDYDFHTELARCRMLVAEVVARDVGHAPPDHPVFGQMTGAQQSKLHAKHIDHHLKQFGV
jgi:hypothetical protein